MCPIEPQARTSTMLNPIGSFDFKRLTYSLARSSPASKCVFPFCSGKPCFATFSLWKLKKTNRPRKRERPVLRLMTTEGLSSALTTADEDLLPAEVDSLGKAEEEPPSRRGRRPWNEMELRFFWGIAVEKVEGESKADALVAIFFFFFSGEFQCDGNEWFWIYDLGDQFWDSRFCL
uniref:Uncharacterized protein n=1 Tax=Noccaea caerulescens TaxID=107243 RepID=A0A1J3FIT7_NOCCA